MLDRRTTLLTLLDSAFESVQEVVQKSKQRFWSWDTLKVRVNQFSPCIGVRESCSIITCRYAVAITFACRSALAQVTKMVMWSTDYEMYSIKYSYLQLKSSRASNRPIHICT